MKRLIIILLTITYLFSSVGVSAKSMYCMGVLRNTTLSYTNIAPTKADCKMAERMKNCCKSKKQLLKVKDQHIYGGTLDLLAKFFPVLFNFTNSDTAHIVPNVSTQQLHYSHAPPVVPKIPVYILNCNYRI